MEVERMHRIRNRLRLGGLAAVALAVLLAVDGRAQQAQQPAQTPKPKGAPGATAASTVAPKLDPKAIELLQAMSQRLAAAHAMTFTVVSTVEGPTRLGPPLAYTTLSEVTLQRPDKLCVITAGDGPASEFYYDGKTMTAFAPAENLVAVADAPPTIDAALKAAYDSAAIYFPFTDVLVADPYKDISDGLKRAFYIGQSHVVGGTTTDMVAIANDRVFAQVWIGADDKLPRMVRAVYLDDPARLRHQVEFSGWKLDGPSARTRSPRRAPAARRASSSRPDPKPPASPGPSATTKPSKSKAK
jgi:hypothetical protein